MPSEFLWQKLKITRTEQEQLKRHHSFCLWFTGLSGAGKSTLANVIQQELHRFDLHTFLLDGDNVRHGLNSDLDFSANDRKENVRRVAEVANLFVDAGVIAIAALISPFEADRKMARKCFALGDFIEVFVNCPIATCMERDPKGLYQKAQAGLISDFTGIGSPYEAPLNPEIVVNTAEASIEECVQHIMEHVRHKIRLKMVSE